MFPIIYFKRMLCVLLVCVIALDPVRGSAQSSFLSALPELGKMVGVSPAFAPALLKGVKLYPEDPFRLDFILDKGNSEDSADQLKSGSTRLIKYFLASITVPEKDLWVNLSPYEKDRIVPDAFGVTEMGRDLLAQDYMLKQVTASVIYPEGELGKAFWARVYAEAQRRYGTSDVPVDTFNKVWIVPEKAVVYESQDSAYVIESRLKVMLEEDYLALDENTAAKGPGASAANKLGSDIVREVVIPILEKEVNEGKNFAQLRQIYHSLILAVWYREKIKESIFGKAYVDRKKTGGVDIEDKAARDKIWAKYVEAFKKGAYNYIKEDIDPATRQPVPRKYFSGGFFGGKIRQAIQPTHDVALLSKEVPDHSMIVTSRLDVENGQGAQDQGQTTSRSRYKIAVTRAQRNEDAKELLIYLTFNKILAGVGNGDMADAFSLEKMIKECPEFINVDMVALLGRGLSRDNSNFRRSTIRTIGDIVDARADLIDESVMNAILLSLKEHPDDIENVAEVIKKVARTKSPLMTLDMVNELVRELKGYLSTDERKYAYVWGALFEMIKARKDFAPVLLPQLMEVLVKEPHGIDAVLAAAALGDIRAIYPDLVDEGDLTARLRTFRDLPMDGHETAFIMAFVKSSPDLIGQEVVDRFSAWKKSPNAESAVLSIIAARKDLINERFVLQVLDLITDHNDAFDQSKVIADIVRARPEFYDIVVSAAWREITDEFFGWALGGGKVIEELMKVNKEIAKDILNRAIDHTGNGSGFHRGEGMHEIVLVIAKAAEIIPEEINDQVIGKVLSFFDKSSFGDVNFLEKMAGEIILSVAESNKNRAIGIIDKLIEKKKTHVSQDPLMQMMRSLGHLNDPEARYYSSEIVGVFARLKPEILDRNMVEMLFDHLMPGADEADRARDQLEMYLAAKAIAEVSKARPDLIMASDLMANFLRWGNGPSGDNPLFYIILNEGINNEKADLYKNDLAAQWNILRSRKGVLEDELLIYADILANNEDIVLLTKFAEQGKKEFAGLISTISRFITMGKGSEIVPLLKQHTDIEAIKQVLSLDRLLEGKGLNVFEPTRSWDNLEEWLSALNEMPFLKDKILPHIVITMALLRQGIGNQAGFRNWDSVETLLPRIRRSVEDLLQNIPDPVARKRLVKVLAFGSPDEIELLRRQAVLMVEALLGQDAREGSVVARIRNRIHNQPSPQDLPVMKAYRQFVDTGDPTALGQFDYQPQDADIVPAARKDAVLLACDDLLKTLEYIYGDENMSALNDFLARLDLGPGESIKGKVRIFVNGDQPKGLDALDKIIAIREDLFALSQNVTGEALLSAIKLDNRMELLYYRFFNEYKKTMDIHNFGQVIPVLLNLLQNASLNGYSPQQIRIIAGELRSFSSSQEKSEEDWLKIYALLKRVENILRVTAKDTVDHYQQTAQRLGQAVGAKNSIWVENFSSNLFRSDTIFLLATLLTDVKQEAMQRAGISGWQVIVPGQAEGRIRFLSSEKELDNVKADEIVVLEKLPSELPGGINVKGIIILSEDSVLSHPAIRARQKNIPMVGCPDKDLIEKYAGKRVLMRISGDEDVVFEEKDEGPVEAKAASQRPRKPRQSIEPLVVSLNKEDGFVIDPKDYCKETVGNKAFQLNKIPAGISPEQFETQHFSLSFGFYRFVVDLPENAAIKKEMDEISARLKKTTSARRKFELLVKMRIAVRRLTIPDKYLRNISGKIGRQFGKNARIFVRSSTNAEDLKGYAGAGLYDSFGDVVPTPKQLGINIRKVWASAWNARAYFDREYHGIDHEKVFPAVLIQEMVPATYAFVVHTRNPSNKDEVVLEVVQGFGEALVGGDDEFIGSPYRFIYDRDTHGFKLARFASKGKKISMSQDGIMETALASYADDPLISEEGLSVMKNIIKGALKIEAQYDTPQDIEGAVVLKQAKWGVAFVQARDQVGMKDKVKTASMDNAAATPGGVDLDPGKMDLKISKAGPGVNFNMDPAMIESLQNATGIMPVILDIQPMTTSVPVFLEGTHT